MFGLGLGLGSRLGFGLELIEWKYARLQCPYNVCPQEALTMYAPRRHRVVAAAISGVLRLEGHLHHLAFLVRECLLDLSLLPCIVVPEGLFLLKVLLGKEVHSLPHHFLPPEKHWGDAERGKTMVLPWCCGGWAVIVLH